MGRRASRYASPIDAAERTTCKREITIRHSTERRRSASGGRVHRKGSCSTVSRIVRSGVSCSEPRRGRALRSVASSHVFTNSQMHTFSGWKERSAACLHPEVSVRQTPYPNLMSVGGPRSVPVTGRLDHKRAAEQALVERNILLVPSWQGGSRWHLHIAT